MSGMIERVGEAVRNAISSVCDVDSSMNEIIGRAAIEAMRKPTEVMIKAAHDTDVATDQYCSTGEEHWRSMIDVALKDG